MLDLQPESRRLMTTTARLTVGSGETFRGPAVCRIVGISYRQLDYWARTNLVQPSISEAHGSGTQRRYSYRDLLELKIIKQLLDSGQSLQSARRAIECLPHSRIDQLAIVITGQHARLVDTSAELVAVITDADTIVNVIPLATIARDLQNAVDTARQHA
jgi:DNA-binding transcriptional MerR regulator